MIRKILASCLLLLISSYVFAANVTATTGWTCAQTLPASMTIDAGSNRQLVIYAVEEDPTDTPEQDITTVGGISPTETITYLETTAFRDHEHVAWVFNEAATASMSGSTISGTDGGAENSWCLGVIEDTDQTALAAFTGTSVDLTAQQIAVTTTSSSGDLIVAAFMKGSNVTGTNWTTYDTLTEIGNVNDTGTDMAFAAGNGGDASTLGVHTSTFDGEMTATSLVFLDVATSSPLLLLRRRN